MYVRTYVQSVGVCIIHEVQLCPAPLTICMQCVKMEVQNSGRYSTIIIGCDYNGREGYRDTGTEVYMLATYML